MKKTFYALLFIAFWGNTIAQQIVPHYLPTTELRAYYPMDLWTIQSGYFAQSSVYGPDGFNHSDPQYIERFSIGIRNGKNCEFANFRGLSGMDAASTVQRFKPQTAMTLSAWVYFRGVNPYGGVGQKPTIVMKPHSFSSGDYNQASYALQLVYSAGTFDLVASLKLDNGDKALVYTAFPQNEWVHVAMSWSAASNEAKLFINGELKMNLNTVNANNIEYSASNPYFLAGTSIINDNNYKFHGFLDEIGLWETQLSDSEIATIAEEPTLDLFYSMNGSAEDANDTAFNLVANEPLNHLAGGVTGKTFDNAITLKDSATLTKTMFDVTPYILADQGSDLWSQSLSMGAWINIDSAETNAYHNIVEVGNAFYLRYFRNYSSFQYGYRDSASYTGSDTVISDPYNRWIHIAIVSYVNPIGQRMEILYLDGAAVDTNTLTSSYGNGFGIATTKINYTNSFDNFISIGSRKNTYNMSIGGGISDVFLTNRILDACDIEELYFRNKLHFDDQDSLYYTYRIDSAAYWINVDSNTVVAVDSNQGFYPTETGNYAIVYPGFNCVDTSASFYYFNPMDTISTDTNTNDTTVIDSTISIAKIRANQLRMYPNPANSMITIESEQPANLVIFNVNGQAILERKITATKETIELTNMAAGVYVVQTTDNLGVVKLERLIIRK